MRALWERYKTELIGCPRIAVYSRLSPSVGNFDPDHQWATIKRKQRQRIDAKGWIQGGRVFSAFLSVCFINKAPRYRSLSKTKKGNYAEIHDIPSHDLQTSRLFGKDVPVSFLFDWHSCFGSRANLFESQISQELCHLMHDCVFRRRFTAMKREVSHFWENSLHAIEWTGREGTGIKWNGINWNEIAWRGI